METDHPTDRPTDHPTDIVTYRAAIAANKGLKMGLVLEKLEILSPSIRKFILTERHLFEVDSRRAGKVAIQLRAGSSKPTIAQNDARHRINEKHAKAWKAPVKPTG